MNKSGFPSAIILIFLVASCSFQTVPAPDTGIKWISQEDLHSILDERGLVIYDARYGKDWARSDRKIKGAVRLDASEVEQMDGFYPLEQKIILYCA